MGKNTGPTSTPPRIPSVPVPPIRQPGSVPPIIVHPQPIPYPTVNPETGRIGGK